MPDFTATAVACANIAFIKYWGNHDNVLRLPANGSISMNLDGLHATTTVHFDPDLPEDQFTLNLQPMSGSHLERVSIFLDIIRRMAGITMPASVISTNNFPTGAGIASSAAAFAALSLAASRAAGLSLPEAQLSALARRGSGSASRSVPGGFVEWLPGDSDASSYAVSIASPDHWDLVDCIAVIVEGHKLIGSSEGHSLAGTSPLQAARVLDASRRLAICRQAILTRDFEAFASIVEQDSNLMHAVMMTSMPALFYWDPASIQIMKSIPGWRAENIPACYTLDAGPNVHIITLKNYASEVANRLHNFPGVKQVLTAAVGGSARWL